MTDFDFEDLGDLDVFDEFEDYACSASAVPVYHGYKAQSSSSSAYIAVAYAMDDSTHNEAGDRKRKEREDAEAQQIMPFKLQRPRILKRDFRRYFPIMWANVFNSCDYDYMMQHLHTYYDPSVAMIQRDMRGPDIKCGNKIPHLVHQLQGVSFLAEFWYQAMNAAPDLVCTLKHTCLKIRSDGTSVIQCCFALTGTKILPVPDPSDAAAVEKLQMYQQLISQRRADITQTAAALAAVAPAKAATALRSTGSKPAKLPHTTATGTAASNSAAVASAAVTAAVPVSAEDTPDVSIDPAAELDKYMDEPTQRSSSSDHTDIELSEGSSITSGRSNIPTITTFNSASSSAPTGSNCSVSELSDQLESLSDLDSVEHISHFSGTTSSSKSSSGGRAAKTAPKTKTATRTKSSKQKEVDWLSLGQQAYRTGAMVSAQAQHSSSDTSSDANSVSTISSAVPITTAQQVVLTGAMDCICSIEMCLNAEHKVVSMVLNYIT